MMLQVLVSQLDAPAPSQDGGMLGYKLVPRPLSLDAVPRSAAATCMAMLGSRKKIQNALLWCAPLSGESHDWINCCSREGAQSCE